jgi:hypothetical protein
MLPGIHQMREGGWTCGMQTSYGQGSSGPKAYQNGAGSSHQHCEIGAKHKGIAEHAHWGCEIFHRLLGSVGHTEDGVQPVQQDHGGPE